MIILSKTFETFSSASLERFLSSINLIFDLKSHPEMSMKWFNQLRNFHFILLLIYSKSLKRCIHALYAKLPDRIIHRAYKKFRIIQIAGQKIRNIHLVKFYRAANSGCYFLLYSSPELRNYWKGSNG